MERKQSPQPGLFRSLSSLSKALPPCPGPSCPGPARPIRSSPALNPLARVTLSTAEVSTKMVVGKRLSAARNRSKSSSGHLRRIVLYTMYCSRRRRSRSRRSRRRGRYPRLRSACGGTRWFRAKGEGWEAGRGKGHGAQARGRGCGVGKGEGGGGSKRLSGFKKGTGRGGDHGPGVEHDGDDLRLGEAGAPGHHRHQREDGYN